MKSYSNQYLSQILIHPISNNFFYLFGKASTNLAKFLNGSYKSGFLVANFIWKIEG